MIKLLATTILSLSIRHHQEGFGWFEGTGRLCGTL